MAKTTKRPLLAVMFGAAAVKVLACAPYPPGNLAPPPQCPDFTDPPCKTLDAGTDGGTGDGGTGGDGGMSDGGDGG